MTLEEIKSRINPQYQGYLGTESNERKWLCDRLDAQAALIENLSGAVERCYKMLLSEPDTKGALFKAENILRETLADLKETK